MNNNGVNTAIAIGIPFSGMGTGGGTVTPPVESFLLLESDGSQLLLEVAAGSLLLET